MRKVAVVAILFSVLYLTFLYSQTKNNFNSEGMVKVLDAMLYYKSVGGGDTIVILHGGPGLDQTYLQPQVDELSKNHTIIYFDQRGTGKSTGAIDSVHITPEQFVNDLEAVRKTLKIKKMNLLGHSWGGLLAMYYGIAYPENLKSLILVSSAGASSDFIGPFIKTRTARTTHEDSIALATLVTSEEFAKHTPDAISKFTRLTFATYFFNRTYLDSLNLHLNQTTANNFLPLYGLMSMYLANYDLYPKLTAIQCPTLILHGDYDPIPVEFSQKLTGYIKHSQFILLQHCGHFPFVEVQKDFIQHCEHFLDQTTQ